MLQKGFHGMNRKRRPSNSQVTDRVLVCEAVGMVQTKDTRIN